MNILNYRFTSDSQNKWENLDGFLSPAEPKKVDEAVSKIPENLRAELSAFRKKRHFKEKSGQTVHFDTSLKFHWLVSVLPKSTATFELLKWARQTFHIHKHIKSRSILVDLRHLSAQRAAAVVDSYLSAVTVALGETPKYKKPSAKKPNAQTTEIVFWTTTRLVEKLTQVAQQSHASAEGTNLVRKLAMMATNDLTNSRYVELATKLAKDAGLETKFYSLKELEKMKAGAFLAVSRGSFDKGGGILKISYRGAKSKKRLTLVGKGLTFDTGGTNLKPSQYILGMHEDMTGSAVALATILLAAKSKWPLQVDAYLAITDNLIGPESFRPNEVVTAMNGTTIEITDTDAEGRMVLADTLHLAAQDKPDLILDFATLTGACIRAIGRTYSGGFTNQKKFVPLIRRAGKISGERIWPFPNDSDFADCLKSDVATTKQCRVSGGVDHIEAFMFLSLFVPKKTPWIHVDLSSCNHDGGLGHVPTTVTGVGVRLAKALTEEALGL